MSSFPLWLRTKLTTLSAGRPGPGWPAWTRHLQLWMAVPPLLTACVVAMTLACSGFGRLEPAEARPLKAGARLAPRFQPGGLVPPLPLPPSAFVHTHCPSLATADRDWTRLAPSFTPTVLSLLARMAERGYEVALLEGYRSPERQTMLSRSGRGVTRASACESLHQHGLAVDLAPIRDGELALSAKAPWALAAYQALGEEAEALGLVWGGRWTFRDLGHVEAPLKAQYRPWRQAPPSPTPFDWEAGPRPAPKSPPNDRNAQ